VYSNGNKEETNLEAVKLIRIQKLIRKQEDIADVCNTVFAINGCNQNRTQFFSCTSYDVSPSVRFFCYVRTTGVFYKSWYLLVLATKSVSCR